LVSEHQKERKIGKPIEEDKKEQQLHKEELLNEQIANAAE
jgi:hypothetical protein